MLELEIRHCFISWLETAVKRVSERQGADYKVPVHY